MKRERALQVALVVVGLLYSFWGYLLFDDLWHSKWLGHSDVMPMFLSLNTVLGVFLLLAVKQPAKHRSVIAYGAWSSLAHAFTMTIQSAEARAHGMHRKDSNPGHCDLCRDWSYAACTLPGKTSITGRRAYQ